MRLVSPEGWAPFAAALSRFRALGSVRRIEAGDERGFLSAGLEPLDMRRASGAARIAARGLLAQLGGDAEAPLVRTPARYPLWPAGFVGSLAHDADFAAAAVARVADIAALGIDVEPAEPLPREVEEIALSLAERREVGDDPLRGRMIFCAKEAAYKAINPFDGTSLEYEDIEISLSERVARLADGRRLQIVTHAGDRLLAAAIGARGALNPAAGAP